METNHKMKHRHALRAEPMKFLIRKFGLRSERVVDGVFELGRTAKTSRTPRMFHMEDTLSPTSPTTHFSAL